MDAILNIDLSAPESPDANHDARVVVDAIKAFGLEVADWRLFLGSGSPTLVVRVRPAEQLKCNLADAIGRTYAVYAPETGELIGGTPADFLFFDGSRLADHL